MWASHFVRNGNKLSISSWLATEVQVCRNVGRPNPRLPNLVILIIMTKIWAQNHKFDKVITFEPDGILTRSKRRFVHLARLISKPNYKSEDTIDVHLGHFEIHVLDASGTAFNIVQLRYAVSFGIWGGDRFRGRTIRNLLSMQSLCMSIEKGCSEFCQS